MYLHLKLDTKLYTNILIVRLALVDDTCPIVEFLTENQFGSLISRSMPDFGPVLNNTIPNPYYDSNVRKRPIEGLNF